MSDPGMPRFCAHCGAIGAARLGPCDVCGMAVCERCGNVQHTGGERKIVHNSCLDKSGDSFSMIKFVK